MAEAFSLSVAQVHGGGWVIAGLLTLVGWLLVSLAMAGGAALLVRPDGSRVDVYGVPNGLSAIRAWLCPSLLFCTGWSLPGRLGLLLWVCVGGSVGMLDAAAVGADQQGGAAGHGQGYQQPADEGQQTGDDPAAAVDLGHRQAESLGHDAPEGEPAEERATEPRARAQPLPQLSQQPLRRAPGGPPPSLFDHQAGDGLEHALGGLDLLGAVACPDAGDVAGFDLGDDVVLTGCRVS